MNLKTEAVSLEVVIMVGSARRVSDKMNLNEDEFKLSSPFDVVENGKCVPSFLNQGSQPVFAIRELPSLRTFIKILPEVVMAVFVRTLLLRQIK